MNLLNTDYFHLDFYPYSLAVFYLESNYKYCKEIVSVSGPINFIPQLRAFEFLRDNVKSKACNYIYNEGQWYLHVIKTKYLCSNKILEYTTLSPIVFFFF